MTPEEAYQKAVDVLRQAGLIVSAYGGIVTFGHPETLKEEGLWDKAQYMAGLGPHPKTIELEKTAGR